MRLFCFASRNIRNIQIGIKHQMWAVASVSDGAMAGRITKAQRYLRPGDFGVIYCNALHAFTTPFIVRSCADPDKIEKDIWPEAWVLPFKIETLGNLSRTVSKEASERWSIVRQRMANIQGRGGVSAAMNITGTTVFVPVPITQSDWDQICGDLATNPC